MSYDFFAERDSAEKLTFSQDYQRAVYSLGGRMNQTLRNELDQEEIQRTQSRGNRMTSSKEDAKNEAKQRYKDESKSNPQFLELVGCDELPNEGSCGILAEWTLKTPFFSRGISEFSAVDNPVSRDRLSGVPVLYASGARGMLRHTYDGECLSEEISDLFGNDRELEDDEVGFAGCLNVGDVCFRGGTFAEIFTPHERASRTVQNPVFFEMVNKDVSAQWSLMLFDFKCCPKRIRELLPSVLSHMKYLIEELGMSAKRSSGYGIGKNLTVQLNPGTKLGIPDSLKRKLPVAELLKRLEELQ